MRPTPSKEVPTGNTRAKMNQVAIRAATKVSPTAKGTRESTKSKTRKLRLMRPTVSSQNKIRTGRALEVESISAKRKTTACQRMNRLENEVYKAMAVMDAETGKLLNYKQLMSYPKYKKKWATSSTNEFGRLANGVRGQTKNSTNTIRFIRRDAVPKDRRKYVTYESFVCNIRPEKKETERTRSVVGVDRINYPGEVALRELASSYSLYMASSLRTSRY